MIKYSQAGIAWCWPPVLGVLAQPEDLPVDQGVGAGDRDDWDEGVHGGGTEEKYQCGQERSGKEYR